MTDIRILGIMNTEAENKNIDCLLTGKNKIDIYVP